MDAFATRLLDWFDRHGRRNLPWQHPRTPYRVWLSEVMLQQTQVRTVIPYFERFVAALPSLEALAEAPLDQVLALWSGLGYYRRARHLHECAKRCLAEHDGELPRDIDALAALPGIGRSTAAAILAQAHGEPHAILDGNVRRVLARHRAVYGWTGLPAVQRELWRIAEAYTPSVRAADYTQAIMDLGALVCARRKPLCPACPVNADCIAHLDALTHVLPEAKPTRAAPTRATHMLVVRDGDGRVLLERRPPTGVWARLWSLPEADGVVEGTSGLARRHGVTAASPRVLADFMHVFSHYKLRVTPVLYAATHVDDTIADDGDTMWVRRDDLGNIGLPAPVRTLLETLMEDAPCEPCTA